MVYSKDVNIRLKNRLSCKLGADFENIVKRGCIFYKEKGIANIEKTPEPFRCMKIKDKGRFEGYFTAKAQPDFQGTLQGGRSIVFECKYTNKESMPYTTLTENQLRELEIHHRLGAVTAVCVCFAKKLQERYFFVPFEFWLDMKKNVGKKSVKAEDLKDFEVKYRYSRGLEFLGNSF